MCFHSFPSPPPRRFFHVYLHVFYAKFMVALAACIIFARHQQIPNVIEMQRKKGEMKNVMCFLMFNVVEFTFFVTNFFYSLTREER